MALIRALSGGGGGGSSFDITSLKVIETKTYPASYVFSNVEEGKYYMLCAGLGTTSAPTVPVVGNNYDLSGCGPNRDLIQSVFKIENNAFVGPSTSAAITWDGTNKTLTLGLGTHTAYGYVTLLEMS